MDKGTFVNKLVFSFLVVVLSGCAFSPQQVTINPRISMDGEQYGGGRSVQVSASDVRADQTLGSRGGVYKDTSVITIENDMPQAIVNAVKAKLATQGFNVNAQDSNADLAVVVEELRYDIPEQSMVKKVDLLCVIRVDIQAGTENFTGRFRTTAGQEMLFNPDMKRNQEMINKVLSDTLARAFSDARLKAFLSNI